jgi:hypothetical protein
MDILNMEEKTPENTETILAHTLTVTDKQLQNLKPWPKGYNPNPKNIGKGGPKVQARARRDLVKILEEQLELNIPLPLLEKIREFYPKASGKMSSAEAIMLRLQLAALAGEPWAIKEVTDRLHGAVKQSVKQEITIGPKLDDLSDDELDQAIKNSASGVIEGAGTQALPE